MLTAHRIHVTNKPWDTGYFFYCTNHLSLVTFNNDSKGLTCPDGVKKLLTTVMICVSKMG